jgi:hypothetical protein
VEDTNNTKSIGTGYEPYSKFFVGTGVKFNDKIKPEDPDVAMGCVLREPEGDTVLIEWMWRHPEGPLWPAIKQEPMEVLVSYLSIVSRPEHDYWPCTAFAHRGKGLISDEEIYERWDVWLFNSYMLSYDHNYKI